MSEKEQPILTDFDMPKLQEPEDEETRIARRFRETNPHYLRAKRDVEEKTNGNSQPEKKT
ncbi:MAG: hypothetical protein NT135_00410 [Candidatus Berkelbacteria bacterium]|nr:hypothetical protein [Candidatus Berkelbacteria bacterium]